MWVDTMAVGRSQGRGDKIATTMLPIQLCFPRIASATHKHLDARPLHLQQPFDVFLTGTVDILDVNKNLYTARVLCEIAILRCRQVLTSWQASRTETCGCNACSPYMMFADAGLLCGGPPR